MAFKKDGRGLLATVKVTKGVLRIYTSTLGGQVWMWIEAYYQPVAPYPADQVGRHSHTVYDGPVSDLFESDHTLVKLAAQRLLLRGIGS